MPSSESNSPAAPLVEVRHLQKSFGPVGVLHDVSLAIPSRVVACIVGPSGAGKSTLLQIVGALLAPDQGSIRVGSTQVDGLSGRALAQYRNREIGFVFQFHNLLPEFSALENVCIPALIGRAQLTPSRIRAKELLDFMGLSHRLNHRPGELSGGEQQRVAVARALMNNPKLILADEPSGNLDSARREELHDLFFKLRDSLGQTFLVVTHDEQLASRADLVIHLKDGHVEQPAERQ